MMDIAEIVQLAEGVEHGIGRLRTRSTLAVMFIDLVGSTEFKNQHPNEEIWLARLAKFLLGVTRIVEADGRVVKYIGDEVMAVFEGGSAALLAEQTAERILDFCDQLPQASLRVKIAIDFGEVSLLHFGTSEKERDGDPNGVVVDRCARIMSKAIAGAVLSSAEFRAQSRSPQRWQNVGSFRAKGIPTLLDVFMLQTRGAPELTIADDPMTLVECRAELGKTQQQLSDLRELARKSRQ